MLGTTVAPPYWLRTNHIRSSLYSVATTTGAPVARFSDSFNAAFSSPSMVERPSRG